MSRTGLGCDKQNIQVEGTNQFWKRKTMYELITTGISENSCFANDKVGGGEKTVPRGQSRSVRYILEMYCLETYNSRGKITRRKVYYLFFGK